MVKYVIVFLVAGLFLIFVGALNIQNVRRALKTGIVSGKRETHNRTKNPALYKLTFGISLIAGIALPLMGMSAVVFALYLLANQ
jgi:predicted permease